MLLAARTALTQWIADLFAEIRSRVWRVWCGVSLQTWGIFLVFGGFGVVWLSKRAQLNRKQLFLVVCRIRNDAYFV